MRLFPSCPECGSVIPTTCSDAPIRFCVGEGEVRTIRRSQEAQMLRFLSRAAPYKPVKEEMFAGMGRCLQVTRILARLRHKWGIPVLREDHSKAQGRGTYGRYYLGDGVRVWEPDDAEGEG